MLGNCLATKNKPEVVNFISDSFFGGILPPGKEEMAKNVPSHKFIKTLCFPLYSLLLALGNPTVHYFRYTIRKIENWQIFVYKISFFKNLILAVWM